MENMPEQLGKLTDIMMINIFAINNDVKSVLNWASTNFLKELMLSLWTFHTSDPIFRIPIPHSGFKIPDFTSNIPDFTFKFDPHSDFFY